MTDYLLSEESIFRARYIMDFIETLNILHFNRVASAKGDVHLHFVNENFAQDRPVADDFYKQPVGVSAQLIGTRRLRPSHHIGLFKRLLRVDKRHRGLNMKSLQFSRLRLKFILQKKLDKKRYEQDIIHHNIDEPDYVKNQDIAGYYGNVEFSALKNGFGNFFPIFEDPTATDEPQPSAENLSATDAETPMEVDPPAVEEEQLIEDVGTEKSRLPMTGSHFDEDDEDDKENQPPQKRQRKNRSSKKITSKETSAALLSLKKELESLGCSSISLEC
jgi:hypothetical protein